MGGVGQEILSLDDVNDFCKQEVLGRVPEPRVENPVWLKLDGQKGRERGLCRTFNWSGKTSAQWGFSVTVRIWRDSTLALEKQTWALPISCRKEAGEDLTAGNPT